MKTIRRSKLGNPRPVLLTVLTNWDGTHHIYNVLHDGECYGEFINDVQSAVNRYEETKRHLLSYMYAKGDL